jgi:hypothetical protein
MNGNPVWRVAACVSAGAILSIGNPKGLHRIIVTWTKMLLSAEQRRDCARGRTANPSSIAATPKAGVARRDQRHIQKA